MHFLSIWGAAFSVHSCFFKNSSFESVSVFLSLYDVFFSPSNLSRTPSDCALESHQGTKFHWALTPLLHMSLFWVLCCWQGSGLFGAPGSTPASHDTFSVSKKRKANKVLVSYRCLAIKGGSICNFLIARLGPTSLLWCSHPSVSLRVSFRTPEDDTKIHRCPSLSSEMSWYYYIIYTPPPVYVKHVHMD